MDGRFLSTGPDQLAPTSLGVAAPNTVVDTVANCIFEANILHNAGSANLLGFDDANAIRREKRLRWKLSAVAICHPFGIHYFLPKIVVLPSTTTGRA